MKQSFFSFKRNALFIALLAGICSPASAADSYHKGDSRPETTPDWSDANQNLYLAIGFNDTVTAQQAIDEGADVNALNPRTNMSPLGVAVFFDKLALIQLLLYNDADINGRNEDNETALMMAVWAKNTQAVSLLLNHGADTTLKDKKDRTAAQYARENQQDDVARMIIQAGVDRARAQQASTQHNGDANDDNDTSAQYTPAPPFTRAVKLSDWMPSDWSHDELSDSDSDSTWPYPDSKEEADGVRDAKGRTKLMNAVLANDYGLAIKLLEQGANPNAHSLKTKKTALFYAVTKYSEWLTDLLLSYGADPRLTNVKEQTPLMYAADGGDDIIVRTLLESGAAKQTINTVDQHGVSALTRAVMGAHKDVVETLIKHGAKLNPEGQGKWTPIAQAYKKRNEAMLQILLAHALEQDDPTLAREIQVLLLKTYGDQ